MKLLVTRQADRWRRRATKRAPLRATDDRTASASLSKKETKGCQLLLDRVLRLVVLDKQGIM